MKIADTACLAKGYVNPSFVDVRTGERIPFKIRHNTLSYMSAEAMAAAFGGDPSYIPSKVGFIYGESNNAPDIGGRLQTWESLKNGLASASADVQVVSFSYSPSLGGEKQGNSSDSSSSSSSFDESVYCNIKPTGSNAITFHAVSNSSDGGEIDKSSVFKAQDRIFQAVLLGFNAGKHYVISRVSLYDDNAGDYLQKPENFEVSLDWTIVFR